MLMTKLGIQPVSQSPLQPLSLIPTRPEARRTELQQKLADIVGMAASLCAAPFAGVHAVSEHTALQPASFGIAPEQMAQEGSLLQQTLRTDHLLAIRDLSADPRFSMSTLVSGPPRLRFFVGMPLRSGLGHPVGVLYVADVLPRELTPQQTDALSMLARHALAEIELRANSMALEATLRQQVRSMSELQNAEARLLDMAEVEAATGLLKRQAFIAHLEREALLAARYRPPLTLFLINIDSVRSEVQGGQAHTAHSPSDSLAAWVSGMLLRLARQTDFVGRLNMETFAILMPSTDASSAMLFSERIRNVLREARFAGSANEGNLFTVSIGAATFHGRMRSGSHLLAAADISLREAIAQGGNCVRFLTPPPGAVTEAVSPLNYTDIGGRSIPSRISGHTGRILSAGFMRRNGNV